MELLIHPLPLRFSALGLARKGFSSGQYFLRTGSIDQAGLLYFFFLNLFSIQELEVFADPIIDHVICSRCQVMMPSDSLLLTFLDSDFSSRFIDDTVIIPPSIYLAQPSRPSTVYHVLPSALYDIMN